MNLIAYTAKREAISAVEFLPAVSIIIPFTPLISAKKNIEYNIKNVLGKVESMLVNEYSIKNAIPVIIKLRNLFCNLNFNTTKKSVAIFVSPVVERVYYFGVEMEEKIVIDPSFTISDFIGCKKEKKEFLILLLGEQFSKMYLGNGSKLKLIKSNMLANTRGYENACIEKNPGGIEMTNQKECTINQFLSQMDKGLSMMLQSYPLPVFVAGPEGLLEQFKTITQNDDSLVQYIPGDYDEAPESELSFAIAPFVSRWKKLKQDHLLKQVNKAKKQYKLKTGITETMKASVHNRVKLLVVEKQFVKYFHGSKNYSPFFKIDTTPKEVYFIKNEVDEIIKNVLESGGDIEFVDDGLLKNHRHIALIEQ